MESTGHISVSVPLRAGKKMKKRKELDALVANSVSKRTCVTSKHGQGGGKGQGQAGGGISSQDQLLLSESTDDHDYDQEYWIAGGGNALSSSSAAAAAAAAMVSKRSRSQRSRHGTRITRKRACTSIFRVCSIILMVACVLATTTVLWLFIDVREQITALRSELDRVVASSQGVPDALQKCHTISKSLQNNQSLIISEINTLKLHLNNYNKNVSEMQMKLNVIEEKLHSVPEYVNVPQQLKQVSSSIANLGSQIKDITNTVVTLKTSKDHLETTNNQLKQNITILTNSVINLQNQSQTPLTLNTQQNNVKIENILKVIDDMKLNLTNINTTLSNNIVWIQDDLKSNKRNVETISNVGQNMSARVSTLEGLCGKSVTQNMLSTNLKGVYDELKNVTNIIEKQALQLNDMQLQVFQLTQNNSELSLAINTLNQSLDEKDKNIIITSTSTSTSTDSPSSTTNIKTNNNNNNTVIRNDNVDKVDNVTVTVTQSSSAPAPVVSSNELKVTTSTSAKNPTAKPSILTP